MMGTFKCPLFVPCVGQKGDETNERNPFHLAQQFVNIIKL